jgi:hypothetical protein
VKHGDAFRIAGNGAPDYLYVPKVHLYKGLPFGLDAGAFVGGASSVGATLFGADLRYALVDDSLTSPAIALRLSGTRSSNIGAVRVQTLAGDLMISKRLTLVTPYAGAGVVRIKATAGGAGLSGESIDKSRVLAGFNVNFAILNLAFEAEKLGGNTTLSAKAGWRF